MITSTVHEVAVLDTGALTSALVIEALRRLGVWTLGHLAERELVHVIVPERGLQSRVVVAFAVIA